MEAEKSLGGRPKLEAPPLADDVRERLMEIAETGAPDVMMARCVGIDPSTFTKWRSRTEPGFLAFFQEIERARANGHLKLLESVRKAAGETDWKAGKYLLSCGYAELSERRAALKAAAEEEAERARLAAAEQKSGDEFADFTEEEWAHAGRMIMERRRAAARPKTPETEAINRAFDAVHEDE